MLKTTPLEVNASKEATKASGRKLGYFVRYSRPGLLEGWKCYQRLSAGKIYPVDSAKHFVYSYPLDSDLSVGKLYPAFERMGPMKKPAQPKSSS